MRVCRQFILLGALVLMWVGLRRSQSVEAQVSCSSYDANLYADTCSHPQSDCLGSAAATRSSCYSNCDNQYGFGTPNDTTCRHTCDSNYSSSASQCNTIYNNCISQRQQACSTQCQFDCSGTTGATCCSYVDSVKGCNFSCGCTLPAPPCPNPLCDGTSWTCYSPILIDVNGNGFELTSAEDGVWFDLVGNGHVQKWSWTAARSDNGFLALDRNGNGIIDDGTELFGSVTPQPKTDSPNGFLALAVYDKPENGGNDDGFIDAQDAIYSKLRVWVDKNHDGISQPDELHSLSELGVARIDLQYQVKPRTDEFGNEFYLRGRVWDVKGKQGGRWAWDVYLRRQP
jgi:hypothetical protein